MPSQLAIDANAQARLSGAVEHSSEDGLSFVRPFNQRLVFRSVSGDVAAAEGVCFGCSAYYLKNGKSWKAFTGYVSAGEGKRKALVLSNEILRKEQEISARAAAKREILVESTPAHLRHQNSTLQMVKDAFGFGDPAARARARQEERAFSERTAEEAHRQRVVSFQQFVVGHVGLTPGPTRTGPNGASSGIPAAMFGSRGLLAKEGSGCLVGMWVSGTQRTGHLTGGHAFAVKPTQDVDGYAVFDPNFGEVRFESADAANGFLEVLIGQLPDFRNGRWMAQQYLGCPAAVEEMEMEFGAMGRLADV